MAIRYSGIIQTKILKGRHLLERLQLQSTPTILKINQISDITSEDLSWIVLYFNFCLFLLAEY